MRNSWHSLVWLAVSSALALPLAAAPGCGRAADSANEATHGDHDHGHHHDHAGADDDHQHGADDGHSSEKHALPADYRQAIAQFHVGADRVAKAIGAGDFEAVHAPLDEIDTIISQLMPIARQSGVPRQAWEEINVARRELRAEFDKLHTQIDAGEAPDYAAARATIEDRLKRLQAVADQLDRPPPSPSEPSPPANTATSEEPTP